MEAYFFFLVFFLAVFFLALAFFLDLQAGIPHQPSIGKYFNRRKLNKKLPKKKLKKHQAETPLTLRKEGSGSLVRPRM
ncbi:MAG: hypothetical protein DRO43_05590 [Candidatus Hecatellales archaeon]|nr:MAG: hypothetical protein DRO43_05590 [Candidatus Hecatellales archaeon]